MKRLLIGGSPCFKGDTLVYTDKGYKEIKDIIVGDKVLTHKNRFKKVTEIGNKESDVTLLKAQGIIPTVVTKNHPYYIVSKKTRYKRETRGIVRDFTEPFWEKVEDLNNDSFLGINVIKEEENPLNLTKEQCWILGRYIADGHYRKDKRKNRKNSYQYQVVFSIGNSKLERFKNKVVSYHFSCYSHSQSVHRCVISSQKLVEFLEKYEFGKGAENKQIPPIIMNLPKELLKEFYDGYLSGDGCDRGDCITFSTVSKRLALGLCLIIPKVTGLNATIHISDRGSTAIIEGRKVNIRKQYIVQHKKGIFDSTQAYITENIIWQPLRSIDTLKDIETVYNLSVEDDESYTANNAIVHNCTHWSIAKNVGREVKAEGMGWELFKNYIIAKEKFNPDFFLYENNWSASKDIKEQISKELGQPLQRINSNLVSAQNRDRFYCHNFGDVLLPEDKGVYLRDILEFKETDDIDRITAAVNKSNRVGGFGNQGQGKRIYDINGKSVCLSAGTSGGGETGQRTGLYAIKKKSNVLCNVYGGKSQNGAVFGLDGKSKTLSAGTGIKGRGIGSSNSPKVIVPTKAVSGKLYEVKDGKIEIKGELYPIALEDGLYEIRMLSVKECCRLQTMPDDYCSSSGISDTRGYSCLGNGWTSEIIIHLLKNGLNEIDRDEKLEVLSMYDGIGTGMYCLKKLGFTNIKYVAYEIDKYAIQVTMHHYPDIIQRGDAFHIRDESWYY